MPSIPQSLLWISLVVLWLFVLVPMLISKRDAVRRTSDVALATRVLNTGRAARLLRRRGGPAAGHRSDPEWQPSGDDLDDNRDEEAHDESTERSLVRAAAVGTEIDSEPDYLDVDVVDEDSGALPVGESAKMAVEGPEDAELSADQTEELPLDFGETPEADEPEDEREPDGTSDEYEYVADSSGLEAPSDTDLQLAESMSAARRRRYESKTSAAVTARKYKFRKRMLTVLALLTVASACRAVHRGLGRLVGVRTGRRGDRAVPGVPASSDTHRGAAAAAPCPAHRAGEARGGEHRRPRVRRCSVTAAAAGFGGTGDRRRGPDLRAPRLRSFRTRLRPPARGRPVVISV